MPCLVIGRGSNLLVADEGWDGVALRLGRGLRGLHGAPPGQAASGRVIVGAAEPMPVLATSLERIGLAGLAFAVAIPGTVGGAVRMNAGAHNGQMADVLDWVEVVRLGTGEVERWQPPRLEMDYRRTNLPEDAVVTRACLSLRRVEAGVLAADMAQMRKWRRESQPINKPSCGSVFRNPPGGSAGRLIEEAAMKGHRVGGAEVSPVHANFITVNRDATARDVHTVIRDVQQAVQNRFGITLHTEVILAGFPDTSPTIKATKG